MPHKYSVFGEMALIAADTVLQVMCNTTTRAMVADIVLSSASTPNDYSASFYWQRTSADGVGTYRAPQPLDFADRAAGAQGKHGYTTEPTITANTVMLALAHNLRATVRWVAAPGYEFIIPALAEDGIAGTCQLVSTQFTETMTMLWEE